MMKRFAMGVIVLSIAAVLDLGAASAVWAADAATGSIKGEITANGVPSPEDVVVFIETMPGDQKPPDNPVTMNQKKLVFLPHVLPIVKGTTVKFQNGDPLLHNVFWTASDDGSYPGKNLGSWGQGDTPHVYVRQSRACRVALQHSCGDGRAYRSLAEPVFCRGRERRRLRNQGRAARRLQREDLVSKVEKAQVAIGESDCPGRQGRDFGLHAREVVVAEACL